MARSHRDILVIVGPRSFADVHALAHVHAAAMEVVSAQEPDEIRSGGGDGTDTYAEQLAWEWSIPFVPMLPRRAEWAGPGGYKSRNEDMAAVCTRMLAFACRWPSSGGAIWTANKAESLGRPVQRVVIPAVVVDGQIDVWNRDGVLVQLLARDGVVVQRSERSPLGAQEWVGQGVDDLLSRLRKQKLRVRWTARPR